MDPSGVARGVPLQQAAAAPMFLPPTQMFAFGHQQQQQMPLGQLQQPAFGPTFDAIGRQQQPGAGMPQQYFHQGLDRGVDVRRRRRGRRDNNANVLLEAAARADLVNRDRRVENTISNPLFWSTVFTTLQQNPGIDEAIRRDLEEQERLLAEARDRRRGVPRQQRQQENGGGGDGPGERTAAPAAAETGTGDTDEEMPMDDGDHTADEYELPDLYGYLNGDLDNMRRAVGVQRLDVLLDELDIDSLWSARDVTISFGPLTRILLRLFIGPYATEEETMITRMLNLGVERAAKNYGFEDYHRSRRRGREEEPFVVTYRRRGRMMRDFAAFRYMLEIAENLGRIGGKHKNDLIFLYLTLTTPEVRLHRKWNNSDDLEDVLAFRDRVTGYAITTPLIMARPMTIEMKLDSVFGNVSANSRLLERSLLAASHNRNRKTAIGLTAAQEVEALMEHARLLDEYGGVGGGGDRDSDTVVHAAALKPYPIEREHAALKQMLELSAVVSMMAEEFRVFVAGAPQSSSSGSSSSRNNSNKNKETHPRNQNRRSFQPYAFRRPIFLAFRPTSVNKYERSGGTGEFST